MKRFFFKKMMKGFTLIEAMVVLALAGGVAATVMYYQGRASSSTTANQTVTAVSNMAAKIRTYFAPQGSYTTLTPAAINGMQLVGQPLVWDGAAIKDPWGNTMSVVGGTTSFAISFGGSGLDREACTNMASALGNGADGVRVGTGLTTTSGAIGGGSEYKSVTTGTVSMANLTAATGCAASPPNIALQYR